VLFDPGAVPTTRYSYRDRRSPHRGRAPENLPTGICGEPGARRRARRVREATRGNPPVATPAGRPEPTSHISPVQADTGVDQAPASQFRGGRPVDVAGGRRLCPAPARPPAGNRSPAPMGEVDSAEQTHPRPRPAGVQEPVHEDWLSGQCIKTVPARSRPAAGFEELPPGHPS
jgi:hypothetical protein